MLPLRLCTAYPRVQMPAAVCHVIRIERQAKKTGAHASTSRLVTAAATTALPPQGLSLQIGLKSN